MRNAADHIGADGHRFGHQRPAVGVRLDPLLREGDNLQVDQLAYFVTHLDHGLERGEFRVGHIDVGAHILDSVVHQHADGPFRPYLDVFMGGDFLALSPAFDAFEQGTAHVPPGFAGSQCGVEVDMRLDKGRHHQVLPCVQVMGGNGRHHLGLRHDGGNALAVQFDAEQTRLAAQPCVDDVHAVTPCRGLHSCAIPAWRPKHSCEKAGHQWTARLVVRCAGCAD
ncbi:hypothetical protein D3C80_1088510 [compost metagenome]